MSTLCVGYEELADTLGLNESTVKRYLDYLVSNSLVIKLSRGRKYCFNLSKLGMLIAALIS